jgi:hypothetical protein
MMLLVGLPALTIIKPAAIILLGVGLLGLIGVSGRRLKVKQN